MKSTWKKIVVGVCCLSLICTVTLKPVSVKATAVVIPVGIELLEVLAGILASLGIAISVDSFFNEQQELDEETVQELYLAMLAAYNYAANNSGGDGDPEPPKFDALLTGAISADMIHHSVEVWANLLEMRNKLLETQDGIANFFCNLTFDDSADYKVDPNYITPDTVAFFSGISVNGAYYGRDVDAILHSTKPIVKVTDFKGTTGFAYPSGSLMTVDLFMDGVYQTTLPNFSWVRYTVYDSLNYSGLLPCAINNVTCDSYMYIGDTLSWNDPLSIAKYFSDPAPDPNIFPSWLLPELPQINPGPMKIPSLEQLQQLQDQIKADPDAPEQPVQDFIESLKPGTDPDPNPDPNPNPDPDPGTDPDPDPGTNNEDFTAPGLSAVFPFCIPFDLIRAVKVLSVEGEAPRYEIPFQIPGLVDYTFVIDMAEFETVVEIFRVLETLGFIIGLILITRNLIRG